MTTLYSRRARRMVEAANDRRHDVGWSDLHQQRQDQLDAARGLFAGLCLAGAVWACIVAAVFAAVWILG